MLIDICSVHLFNMSYTIFIIYKNIYIYYYASIALSQICVVFKMNNSREVVKLIKRCSSIMVLKFVKDKHVPKRTVKYKKHLHMKWKWMTNGLL